VRQPKGRSASGPREPACASDNGVWGTVGVIVATLIAAAVADNFDAPRAWVTVGFAAAYIVSRFSTWERGQNKPQPRRSYRWVLSTGSLSG
jgi:hypothetical protein